ncbi:MAG: hypothetical protein EA374_06725 [Acholeplasmatales bacterium]|nr:MAG: hypothetical protein EA374_06725 [Acholeplasmatales bacterium]
MLDSLAEWLANLDRHVDIPILYGAWSAGRFHYLSLLAVIAGAWFSYAIIRHAPAHRLFRYLGVLTILGLAGELLRQVFALSQNDWAYPWSFFPYAFYMSGLLSGLGIMFFKDRALGKALQSYLGSFAFCGALMVLARPDAFYGHSLLLNVLTVLHHGLVLSMGIALIAHRRQVLYRWFLAASGWMLFFTGIGYATGLMLAQHASLGLYRLFFITPPEVGMMTAWFVSMQRSLPFEQFTLLYYGIFVVVAFVTLNFAVYIMDRLAWEIA